MRKTRLYYLDAIKAFAMILVIWGHCGARHDFPVLCEWVYSIHVPVFFVVSGFLMEEKRKTQGKYSINYKLLVPYFVFSAMYALLGVVMAGLTSVESAVEYLKQSLWRIFVLDGQIATWYLSCLILCEICLYVESKVIKGNRVFILNWIASALICMIPFEDDNWPVICILRVFPALLCLNAGVLISKYGDRLNLKATGIIFLSSLLIIAFNGETDMYLMNTGRFSLLYSIQIVLAAVAVFHIFKKCFSSEFVPIAWFGQNTLIVLGTHQAVLQIIYPILGHYQISLLGIIPTSITLTILVVVIEIPIIFIINKWFSWSLGKKIRVADAKRTVAAGTGQL